MNKPRINEKDLFTYSLLLLPALFFQKHLVFLFLDVALLICFAKIKGKHIRFLSNFFLLFGIIFFSLLSPQGKILFSFGKFSITLGALEIGLRKGLILLGMVYCSQVAISKNLSLPGKIGKFIGTVFSYFEEITSSPFTYTKTEGIISSIDTHILEAYTKSKIDPTIELLQKENPLSFKTNFFGYSIVIGVFCFFYLPLFF